MDTSLQESLFLKTHVSFMNITSHGMWVFGEALRKLLFPIPFHLEGKT